MTWSPYRWERNPPLSLTQRCEELGVEAVEERREEGGAESESRMERNRIEKEDPRKERIQANLAPAELGNLVDPAETGETAADEAVVEALGLQIT